MLYHYTSKNGLLGILSSKAIWLVSSREMSDVTDRFYGNLFATVALLKSEDQDIKLLREHLTAEDIIAINMQTLQVEFYSASFCDKSDNDYLWENYADSDKGVCLAIDDGFFLNHMNSIIEENLEQIDEDDETTESSKDLLLPRKVEYGYPIELFIKVIKDTKKMAIGEDDCDFSSFRTKQHYKNWLLLALIILAGVVKGNDYSKENEIRLLFQNRYSDEYIAHSGIYALAKMRMIKAFELLGISQEVKDDKKRRMELNLSKAFRSDLIPAITIGMNYDGSVEELKTRIRESGLIETKLFNRKGEEL